MATTLFAAVLARPGCRPSKSGGRPVVIPHVGPAAPGSTRKIWPVPPRAEGEVGQAPGRPMRGQLDRAADDAMTPYEKLIMYQGN